MVLQVLLQICKNPQALVDIFINYDCDLDSKDVYERIINDLSRIAHGRHMGGDPGSEVGVLAGARLQRADEIVYNGEMR